MPSVFWWQSCRRRPWPAVGRKRLRILNTRMTVTIPCNHETLAHGSHKPHCSCSCLCTWEGRPFPCSCSCLCTCDGAMFDLTGVHLGNAKPVLVIVGSKGALLHAVPPCGVFGVVRPLCLAPSLGVFPASPPSTAARGCYRSQTEDEVPASRPLQQACSRTSLGPCACAGKPALPYGVGGALRLLACALLGCVPGMPLP